MYCGGSKSPSCPVCHQSWAEHEFRCNYYDKATKQLNARPKRVDAESKECYMCDGTGQVYGGIECAACGD